MRGIFVETNGNIEVRNYTKPLFESLGKDVGGYIERVNPKGLPRNFVFVCNDEGLLKNLKRNAIATKLYQHEYIAGNIVILKEGYTDEGVDFVEMSDDEITVIIHLLKKLKEELSNA